MPPLESQKMFITTFTKSLSLALLMLSASPLSGGLNAAQAAPVPEASASALVTPPTSPELTDPACQMPLSNRFYETLGADYTLMTPSGPLLIHGRQSWQALAPITQNRLWAPYAQPLCQQLKKITVHHTHSLYTIQSLQVFHQTQADPKADIAYHFFIDRDGEVYEARPLGYIGSHSEGDNTQNLGIVLNGDFQKQAPAPLQLAALKHLLQGLKGLCPCGFEDGLWTHQERKRLRFPEQADKQTACPGQYLAESVFDFAQELGFGPNQKREYMNEEFSQ